MSNYFLNNTKLWRINYLSQQEQASQPSGITTALQATMVSVPCIISYREHQHVNKLLQCLTQLPECGRHQEFSLMWELHDHMVDSSPYSCRYDLATSEYFFMHTIFNKSMKCNIMWNQNHVDDAMLMLKFPHHQLGNEVIKVTELHSLLQCDNDGSQHFKM